jgi:hypothetical protein
MSKFYKLVECQENEVGHEAFVNVASDAVAVLNKGSKIDFSLHSANGSAIVCNLNSLIVANETPKVEGSVPASKE